MSWHKCIGRDKSGVNNMCCKYPTWFSCKCNRADVNLLLGQVHRSAPSIQSCRRPVVANAVLIFATELRRISNCCINICNCCINICNCRVRVQFCVDQRWIVQSHDRQKCIGSCRRICIGSGRDKNVSGRVVTKMYRVGSWQKCIGSWQKCIRMSGWCISESHAWWYLITKWHLFDVGKK